jgi:hypothetical protein
VPHSPSPTSSSLSGEKLLTAAASQALGFVGLPPGDLIKHVRFGPAMEGCRSVSTLNVRGQVSSICLA